MPENIESEFVVDNEIKQEFLDSQKKSTGKSYAYILKKADEFEQEIGKSIYDFNINDIDELLLVQYKNGSKWAVQSTLSPLRKYVDFCISKHLVRHNENRFSAILSKDYKKYVNNQATDSFYISKEEVRELQKKILNEQDKLILELLSWGVRGRTEKGNTNEELINLRVQDVKWDTKELYLFNNDGEFRHIKVDEYTLKLIRKTINQDFYIYNNGFKKKRNENGINEQTTKGLPINETEYIFRIPGRSRYGKVDSNFFLRRIEKMQKWAGYAYLSTGNLYFSAIIDYAKQKVKEKGELTREDYIQINERFQYGANGEKYQWKIQELIKMYI